MKSTREHNPSAGKKLRPDSSAGTQTVSGPKADSGRVTLAIPKTTNDATTVQTRVRDLAQQHALTETEISLLERYAAHYKDQGGEERLTYGVELILNERIIEAAPPLSPEKLDRIEAAAAGNAARLALREIS